jgi:hypothetical protein
MNESISIFDSDLLFRNAFVGQIDCWRGRPTPWRRRKHPSPWSIPSCANVTRFSVGDSAVDVTRWPTGHCASGIFARDNDPHAHEPAPLLLRCCPTFPPNERRCQGGRILKIEPRESRPTSNVVLEGGWRFGAFGKRRLSNALLFCTLALSFFIW